MNTISPALKVACASTALRRPTSIRDKNLMNSLETGLALGTQVLPDDTSSLASCHFGRDDLFTKAFTMPA